MTAPDYEFVALEPIEVNGVLGYNVGDHVPADVKKSLGLTAKQVAPRKDKAEKADAS